MEATAAAAQTTEEDAWQVQGVKRRLAPQFTLSRADMAAPPKQTPAVEPVKKINRYTREELMAVRRRSTVLQEMQKMDEVVSMMPLDPVCLHPPSPADIGAIWSAAQEKPSQPNQRDNAPGKYSRAKSDELWDDLAPGNANGNASTLDLADFAAATLKFHSETQEMYGGTARPAAEEDVMERLVREQGTALTDGDGLREGDDDDLDLDFEQLLEGDDDEAAPEWDDVPAVMVAREPPPLSALSPNPTKYAAPQTQISSSSTRPVQVQDPPSPFLMPSTQPQQQRLWEYRDPHGMVQGPFENASMFSWLEAGFFKADLPIKLSGWRDFYSLGVVFPVAHSAFREFPPEPTPPPLRAVPVPGADEQRAAEAARVRQQQQQQLQQQQEEFQRQQLELERRQREERAIVEARLAQLERAAQAAPVPVEQTSPAPLEESRPNTSRQLKSLLGVSGSAGSGSGSAPWSSGSASATPSLRDIQQQQEALPKPLPEPEQPAPLRWATPSVAAPSLREIMTHEQRAVQAQEQAGQGRANLSSTWAAKLGGANVPPSSWAPQPAPVSVGPATTANRVKPEQSAIATAPKAESSSREATKIESSMPPELAEYCTSQLVRFKGDADLALMEFVYSLDSPADIRAYVAQYLGSTPAISQFASEFIRRKESLSASGMGAASNDFKKITKKKKGKLES